jgi:O-antigen ligase
VGRLLARLDWPDRVGLALVLVWMLWAATAALLDGRLLSPTSPYVLGPLFIVAGVVAGRLIAPHASARRTTLWLLVAVLLFLTGVLIPATPVRQLVDYANAYAAVAVQLLALCGLALLSAGGLDRLLLGVASLGALLVIVDNRSVAGLAVVGPLVLAILLVVWRPPRHRWWAVTLGVLSLLAGSAAVLALAGRAQWPPRVLQGLDSARKQLWNDALALWRAHPLTGGGPGSFRDASPLAIDPDTSTAHSSLLQVGSETGVIGVVVLALLVVTGLVVACRGVPAAAVVGVAGWTALWVHSLADHLLEFAVVAVAAGMVLGWAGAVRSEQLDVAEGEGPVPR